MRMNRKGSFKLCVDLKMYKVLSYEGITKARFFTRFLYNSSSDSLKIIMSFSESSSTFTGGFHFQSKNYSELFLAFQLLRVCSTRVLSSAVTSSWDYCVTCIP